MCNKNRVYQYNHASSVIEMPKEGREKGAYRHSFRGKTSTSFCMLYLHFKESVRPTMTIRAA